MVQKRLGMPDQVPDSEAREDARPLLFPVVENVGPHGKTLYLGNLAAAENAACLFAAGITETLNVSINMFPGPLMLQDGVHIRRHQIGMIDGAGNDVHLMAAAVYLIEGLMRGYVPAKPHYPKHRPGHILVHCRGGRSRSVALIALWLSRFMAEDFAGFDAALKHLRRLRGLGDSYPLPPMLALADEVQRLRLIGNDPRGVPDHGG
ncbi:dual specificity protein phosphatase family protein [Martelella alba]|uniref:Dual specificity protein phosphatase family protein n=1 Tax=Martelella alba TaxID=2590451 RepID=A0A506U310_9HYPH|nr:dual specificity protein phosphatase [Martelella alba]TPW27651.1 dual specificity protein phosphatase family protein [Martelella alba]